MSIAPLTWTLARWADDRLELLDSASAAWRDVPTYGVLWVDLKSAGYTHRLLGMDTYWVDDDRAGMLADPASVAEHGGRSSVAYRATRDGFLEVDPAPPAGAHLARGELLPDHVWADLIRRPTWRS